MPGVITLRLTAEFQPVANQLAETIQIYSALNQDFSDEFFVVLRAGKPYLNLGITVAYHCSPFRQIEVFGDFIAIGLEDIFLLFSVITRQISVKKMDGYFGHLYVHGETIYACSASNIVCFDSNGELKWESNPFSIDGVIINDFTTDIIQCSGEMDPPGGWKTFELSIENGAMNN